MSAARKKTRKKAAGKASARELSIEETWRHVDRLCRAMWLAQFDEPVPSSLAEIISKLRDEQVVPAHEANMMHTIRAFRNLVVHEDAAFGKHETVIARAAWEIVATWARRCKLTAWRQMLKLVA